MWCWWCTQVPILLLLGFCGVPKILRVDVTVCPISPYVARIGARESSRRGLGGGGLVFFPSCHGVDGDISFCAGSLLEMRANPTHKQTTADTATSNNDDGIRCQKKRTPKYARWLKNFPFAASSSSSNPPSPQTHTKKTETHSHPYSRLSEPTHAHTEKESVG